MEENLQVLVSFRCVSLAPAMECLVRKKEEKGEFQRALSDDFKMVIQG